MSKLKLKAQGGWKLGKTFIYIKAYLYALVLTVEELRKLIDKSKTKQRGRLMGCIIYNPHWLQVGFITYGQMGGYYIFTSTWGFQRCSFRLVGQCEGLSIVERATELAPRFYYINQIFNLKNRILGAVDAKNLQV